MVSLEDPDHLEKTKGFVRNLRFRAHDEPFTCTKEDLVRLGYAFSPSIAIDDLALTQGSGQLKMGFDQLSEDFDQSKWARAYWSYSRKLVTAQMGGISWRCSRAAILN
jgi:hypothetical protein